MIAPLRMVFLVLVLHTPLPLAGFIEGAAETTASLLKIVSGRLADRVVQRKPLLLIGYGLSNAAKPLLGLATGWPHVLSVVFLDRVGKGVRGSPRDALLADATPATYRGKAFGFHRAMDTLGAACGPLLALWLISRSPEQDQQTLSALRPVFGWTAAPGLLSVLVLVLFLKERPRERVAPQLPVAPRGDVPRAVDLDGTTGPRRQHRAALGTSGSKGCRWSTSATTWSTRCSPRRPAR
jgi:MFS family permease